MANALVVSAAEAAAMLRVRPDLILTRLNAGEIPAYREGANWKIPISMLNAYIENRALTEAKERRALHERMQNESEKAWQEAGLTQQQMADALEISLRHYKYIESGERLGSIELWDRLEDILGIHQRILRSTE